MAKFCLRFYPGASIPPETMMHFLLFCLGNRNCFKLPEKIEISRKVALKNLFFERNCLKKSKFFRKFAWKNQNFFNRIHDPRFQTRLTILVTLYVSNDHL